MKQIDLATCVWLSFIGCKVKPLGATADKAIEKCR